MWFHGDTFNVVQQHKRTRRLDASEPEITAVKRLREKSDVPPGLEPSLVLFPGAEAPGYFRLPLRGGFSGVGAARYTKSEPFCWRYIGRSMLTLQWSGGLRPR